MSQNSKSSGSDKNCGSFLFRHRSDAGVALQQSPILQSDIDKIMKMDYNSKSELTLRSVLRSESLRPFTQLNEQILKNKFWNSYIIKMLPNTTTEIIRMPWYLWLFMGPFPAWLFLAIGLIGGWKAVANM